MEEGQPGKRLGASQERLRPPVNTNLIVETQNMVLTETKFKKYKTYLDLPSGCHGSEQCIIKAVAPQ